MKKNLLTLICICLGVSISSQQTLFFDDFESYTKQTEPIVDLKLTRMESIDRYKRCLNNEKS